MRPTELDESPVPPVTKALAPADEFQRLLDTGAVKRRADLARRFKLSRTRVTQLLDLHKLHPKILDFVRGLSGVGQRYLSVRQLRKPEESVLHGVVSKNLRACLEAAEERSEHGFGYPAFVEREFKKYLGCGQLRRGFVRVKPTAQTRGS